jgi:hypothetical protein
MRSLNEINAQRTCVQRQMGSLLVSSTRGERILNDDDGEWQVDEESSTGRFHLLSSCCLKVKS